MLCGSAALIALHQQSAMAGVYQALCSGSSECTVTLMNGQISMPGQTIPMVLTCRGLVIAEWITAQGCPSSTASRG